MPLELRTAFFTEFPDLSYLKLLVHTERGQVSRLDSLFALLPAPRTATLVPPTALQLGRSQHPLLLLTDAQSLVIASGCHPAKAGASVPVRAVLQICRTFFDFPLPTCPSQFSPVFEPSKRIADDVLHGHFLEVIRVGLALSQPTRRKPPHDVASPPSDSVRKKGPTRLAGGTRAPDAFGY